ncbi:hypothetical protein Hanom_Chr04g00360801 [Helianthus anomalus]
MLTEQTKFVYNINTKPAWILKTDTNNVIYKNRITPLSCNKHGLQFPHISSKNIRFCILYKITFKSHYQFHSATNQKISTHHLILG